MSLMIDAHFLKPWNQTGNFRAILRFHLDLEQVRKTQQTHRS